MELLKLPDEVKYLLARLAGHGFEAYVVGGCVRDSLLGRKVKDWDITTDAQPANIVDLFERTIPTGLKHGTVTVLLNHIPLEVTTYRYKKDGINHSFQALHQDLSHRDFTINAMAYSDESGLVDPFSGQKDLEARLIKCVGSAQERFTEDPLRMLRCIRFAAQLGFEITKDTLDTLDEKNGLLQRVSAERIAAEMNKILVSDSSKLSLLIEKGLMQYIVPEFMACVGISQDNKYHLYDIAGHILKSVDSIENDLVLKLTMLLHDIGKSACKTIDKNGVGHFYGHAKLSAALAKKILRRLKYDNKTINNVEKLILYHDNEIPAAPKNIRKWLNRLGVEGFNNLLAVKEADLRAQNFLHYEDRHQHIEAISRILDNVLQQGQCFSKEDLAVTGKDLLALGYEGKIIGQILKELMEIVLENPEMNEQELLLGYLKQKEFI